MLLIQIVQHTDPLSIMRESAAFSVFNIIKDVLLLLVAISGVAVATQGLRTWRKQLKGKTEYDLTRRLLKAVYFTRDQIKYVRNPVMWGGEIERAMKEIELEANPRDSKYHANSSRAVYSARLYKLNEAISNLRLELLEAEVIWGNKVNEIFKNFYVCIGELNFAIYQHLESLEGKIKLESEEWKKKEYIIYDTSDDPLKNEFSGKIKSSVESIENFIRPKLKM